MALTEQEKKTMKAYNIGYTLSIYEPKLLDNIIRNNPDNEFVRAMQTGRDHHEFHAGIPRKDHTRDFKNGYYNGRTLAEFSPEVMDRMLKSDGVSKDFKNGLTAAKTEFSIKEIKAKAAQEKTQQNADAPAPEWLQKKQEANKNQAPAKRKAKDIDRD